MRGLRRLRWGSMCGEGCRGWRQGWRRRRISLPAGLCLGCSGVVGKRLIYGVFTRRTDILSGGKGEASTISFSPLHSWLLRYSLLQRILDVEQLGHSLLKTL